MAADKIALLALIRTPGIGSVTIRQLINYCGGADKIHTSPYRHLIKIPGIGEKTARSILSRQGWSEAEKEWNAHEKGESELIFYTDPKYPSRLKSLYDSPLLLYSKGVVDYNNPVVVGIVGTRKVTDYGKNVTETIIRELAPYKPLVVSGLAYGVDIVAHRACLKYGVATVGVMASGLDIIYPSVHKRTSEEMQQNGGILTEAPPGTRPDPMRFPARNRIIAGMSDVTIVVESAAKGGSLITTEYAQNYHRDVYAVPGNLGSLYSDGCNQLIKHNKASIFISVADMAADQHWKIGGRDSIPSHNGSGSSERVFEGFTQEEGQVLALLRRGGDMQIDDLSWQTGIHLGKLATLLLNLEFQGMVRSLPGKKYALI